VRVTTHASRNVGDGVGKRKTFLHSPHLSIHPTAAMEGFLAVNRWPHVALRRLTLAISVVFILLLLIAVHALKQEAFPKDGKHALTLHPHAAAVPAICSAGNTAGELLVKMPYVVASGVLPEDLRAVNPLNTVTLYRHLPEFLAFPPFTVPFDFSVLNEWVFDFTGMKTRRKRYCNDIYMSQGIAHALRVQACQRLRRDVEANTELGVDVVRFSYPLIGEEYWEYSTVLRSVITWQRDRPYTVIEIGCGYGHWTVSALLAHKTLHGANAAYSFRALDGGEDQVAATREHMKDNGLAHEGNEGEVIYAAVVPGPEHAVSFSAKSSFGAVAGQGDLLVPAMNLTTLVGSIHAPIVDLLDMDIQGGEHGVFDAHMDIMNSRVKLVQLGTHGPATTTPQAANRKGNEIDQSVRALFLAHGWIIDHFFPRTNPRCEQPTDIVQTDLGPVCFADGSFTASNPRLQGK
jgi:hypothetical protein